MAKSKSKSKSKSSGLPKTIAGVRIPKRLRKSGASLAAFLDSPLGREVAAAALTAMAAVFAGRNRQVREQVRETAGDAGHAAVQAGAGAGTLMRDMAEAAVGVVADAAREFVTTSGKSDAGRSDAPAPKRRPAPTGNR